MGGKRIGIDEVREWLSTNAPHIELVSYGGTTKALSKFSRTDIPYLFTKSFHQLRGDFVRGRGVGLSPDERKSKLRKTWDNKSDLELSTILDKRSKTNREKYAADNYFASSEWREKAGDVYEASLGFRNPASSPDVVAKIQATNLKRFGAKTYAESVAQTFEGDTVSDIVAVTGMSKSWVAKVMGKGLDPYELSEASGTSIEVIVRGILSDLGVTPVEQKKLNEISLRPDFRVGKVVVECDGVYWHSDAHKDKKFHMNRRSAFLAHGYKPLFFRGDEIRNKPGSVRSILAHKLGLSKRVHARQCSLEITGGTLISQHHLMGPGQGRVYSLVYKGDIVSSMQIKGKRTKEISRFCTKGMVHVPGGFTRLLAFALREEGSYDYLKTFIDLRYGNGEYLVNHGFAHAGTHLSFRWVKQSSTVHRSKFPGNSGYEQGYRKLWDCGQAKWVLQ